MMRARIRRTSLMAALLAGAVAGPLQAQGGGGYLFGPPKATITVRGGYATTNAGSDIFSDLRRDLTFQKSKFSGAAFGAELAYIVAPQLELTVDAGYMRSSISSNYTHAIDNNNNEIVQTTALQRIPATLNAKVYLAPRGRAVGRFAWIPSTVAPWIGAGAGVMGYRLSQDGDFVDVNTNKVFHDSFVSRGTTPMAQGMAGVDVNISPRFAITGDARYLWAAKPDANGDFRMYAPLDLSGVVLSLGLTVRL